MGIENRVSNLVKKRLFIDYIPVNLFLFRTDLSIRANCAIFALNNKYKISKLPKNLAIELFNSLIAPILLYGSEVWGPYLDNDYLSLTCPNPVY